MKAAPQRGALPTALWLLQSGLWPIVIERQGKKPLGRDWAASYPTRDRLLATFARHSGAGVGIALGPDTGVVDFEIDQEDKAAALLNRLELPDSLGWQSARGRHRLFLWDHRLEKLVDSAVAHFDGTELRIGGVGKQLASVVPPSVGDDGRRRRWCGPWLIAPLPESLLRELERPKALPRPRSPIVPTGTSRYAQAALHSEARAVRQSKPGARNNQLNKSAFCLGQLVASGFLTKEAVEAELTEAAFIAGLGEREVTATLRSGFEAGMLRPRCLRG